MQFGKPTAFALVDCNAFYCSCEAVFEPKLWTTPLAVLSNNDGCVVAINGPAKKLGVPKGGPFFKLRALVRSGQLVVRSSNYTLYGSMSRRVMDTLKSLGVPVEVYSVDEAFLALGSVRPEQREAFCRRAREAVLRWTGIPTSIGIGPTKTLAKLANRIAKNDPEATGQVFDLGTCPDADARLGALAVTEVWGIGSRWGRLLAEAGIATALALKQADDWWVRRKLGVVGLRTVLELRGLSCLPLETAPKRRKQVCVSRSFGRPVRERTELEEAVANFVARAARKLRREGLTASQLTVFVATSRFGDNYFSDSATCGLTLGTNLTPALLKAALPLVQRLWRAGIDFAKAGVVLAGIGEQHAVQLSLFDPPPQPADRRWRAQRTIDALNIRHGRDTLRYAVQGTIHRWQARAAFRSPRYTTRWNELPQVEG